MGVRVGRAVAAERVVRRDDVGDLALLVQQRVEGVAVEELGLLEAGRELFARGAALVGRVALRADPWLARVRAVEALVHPEWDRAVVHVRGDVRVAARPRRDRPGEAEA